MTEQQLLKTLIEYIKYEEIKERDELLVLLRNSVLSFNNSNKFTSKSWQFYEYVDLRVPIPLLKRARELKDCLNELISLIYVETDEYDYGGLHIKPKPVELEIDEIKEHDVVFDEIKDTLIQGIRNAKYLIWVAVAWFTDKDIYEEILLKKKQGVNIRIITSSEKSNEHILNLMEENFEVTKVPLRGTYLSNRMHDKFCIIDLDYVMHGSYNWSKNAARNDETLATALDRDFVKKFTDEFIRLHNENQ